MNFSEPIKLQNSQLKWSDCGHLLASSCGTRLSIWDAASIEVLEVFTTKECIDYIEFSPDSNFILAANYSGGVVHLFSINSPEWSGRIYEGMGGILKAEWSQDSRHIITTSEFNVKLTFWSLSSKSVSYIRNPKTTGRSVHYNKDKSFGLVGERAGCRDLINILTTDDWSLVRQIEVDTEDLNGIIWSPVQDSFVIWDTPLNYRIQVYSVDGRLQLDYSAYQHQLGVKQARFSKNGELFAVGSYDNKIRIFNTTAWTLVHEIDHFHALHEGDPVSKRTVVYQEEDVPLVDVDAKLALELGGILVQQTRYRTVDERPIFLDFSKPDPKKAGNLKIGIGILEWSFCGRYLASRCDSLHTGVWIWDLTTLKLAALLVHKASVKQLQWERTQPRLATITGGTALYFWTPLGAIVGRIPSVSRGSMTGVTDISWNKKGKSLALFNRDSGVLCRLQKKKPRNIDEDLDLEPSRDTPCI